MSQAQTQRVAGAAAAEAVRGTPAKRNAVHLATVLAALRDPDQGDVTTCTDSQWAGRLAYLDGYLSVVVESQN